MTPFFILVISALVLQSIGWLGIERLNSWEDVGLIALVITFIFTGATHFSAMKHDYAAMIPRPFPKRVRLIYLTGLLEIAGAVGLLLPRTRDVAGVCLIILLVGLFSANNNAALNNIAFRGKPPSALWLRGLIQLFFVAVIWYCSVSSARNCLA